MLDMPFGSKRDREGDGEREKMERDRREGGRQQLSSGLAWLSAKADCVARAELS